MLADHRVGAGVAFDKLAAGAEAYAHVARLLAAPNQFGETSLGCALRSGHVECSLVLLRFGALSGAVTASADGNGASVQALAEEAGLLQSEAQGLSNAARARLAIARALAVLAAPNRSQDAAGEIGVSAMNVEEAALSKRTSQLELLGKVGMGAVRGRLSAFLGLPSDPHQTRHLEEAIVFLCSASFGT